ncbi:hypothetical protein R1flu_027141 [Riccia fluitans]|uniref:Uncharacterized protein n=1 Tax=Riccia fluitans TaxID=41844 RepID=A0ABD1XIP1_9MARC
MFVESELTWMITISACHLKSDFHIQRALLTKLLADFDKVKCSERHGYYICVTTIEEIGTGKMCESKGWISYNVRFRCLTYKPHQYEIGFAVVTRECHEKGALCSFGPMEDVFLPFRNLRDRFELIPAKEKIQAHFQAKDGSVIKNGSVLRVQIINVRYDSRSCEFEAICVLKEVDRRTWENTTKPQTTHDCEDISCQKVYTSGVSDASVPDKAMIAGDRNADSNTESFRSWDFDPGEKSAAPTAERTCEGYVSPTESSGGGDGEDHPAYPKSYAGGYSSDDACLYTPCYCRYEL